MCVCVCLQQKETGANLDDVLEPSKLETEKEHTMMMRSMILMMSMIMTADGIGEKVIWMMWRWREIIALQSKHIEMHQSHNC